MGCAGGATNGSASQVAASPTHVDAAAGSACVRKLYWAVVEGGGTLPDAGKLRAAVPGGAGAEAAGSATGSGSGSPPRPQPNDGAAAERVAITNFRVRARHDGLAWLELEPITGATHSYGSHAGDTLQYHAGDISQCCCYLYKPSSVSGLAGREGTCACPSSVEASSQQLWSIIFPADQDSYASQEYVSRMGAAVVCCTRSNSFYISRVCLGSFLQRHMVATAGHMFQGQGFPLRLRTPALCTG